MRYMGGKFRQSKAIVSELVNRYGGQKSYYEPFCGAMGVAYKAIPALASLGVTKFGVSDVSRPLMAMWEAIAYDGWTPPKFTTEKDYNKYKEVQDPDDPMTAWCGFALSFGGKWFGGYARHSRNSGVCQRVRRSQIVQRDKTIAKAAVLKEYGVKMSISPYRHVKAKGSMMYLDPPYQGRTKAHNCGSFNHEAFWLWAEKMAVNNDVLVTEFTFPTGWRVIHSWGDTVVRHTDNFVSDGTNEVLLERKRK